MNWGGLQADNPTLKPTHWSFMQQFFKYKKIFLIGHITIIDNWKLNNISEAYIS